MIPLVDMHCHLLAGFDDGPQSDDDALTMCKLAYDQGTRVIAAGAHQNESWPEVTPERIRHGATRLAGQLQSAGIALTVFPCAEVMVFPEIVEDWNLGKLLSVADRGKYLLIEYPHDVFVDLRDIARRLCHCGVRPILAHPERCPELLEDASRIESLVRAGCLVQVSAASITQPQESAHERALRDWVKRGLVHFLGSDGHSPKRRPPFVAEAYARMTRWTDPSTVDRICSTNGLAVAHGLPLSVPEISPRRKTAWFAQLWS